MLRERLILTKSSFNRRYCFNLIFLIVAEKNDTSSIISINEPQNTVDTDIDDECFHDVMEVNFWSELPNFIFILSYNLL